MLRQRFNPLLTIVALCILTGALLIIVAWVSDVTSPRPQPYALWGATLPGDVGRAGYIALW
jgi:hypothetical protein